MISMSFLVSIIYLIKLIFRQNRLVAVRAHQSFDYWLLFSFMAALLCRDFYVLRIVRASRMTNFKWR